jgi:HK97 family phage major capsid protein
VPAAHVIPASGGTTPTVAQIDADARKAEMALLGSDVLMTNVRWLMNPREFTFLRDLRDAKRNLVYAGLSQPTPTWKGFPAEVTNQIPRNLGGTEDESEIYLVDFDLCLIADSYQVRIDASENAAYRSGEEMVSAFSRNQTVIRALAGHDFGMTQKVGAAVLSGVRWGAG